MSKINMSRMINNFFFSQAYMSLNKYLNLFENDFKK